MSNAAIPPVSIRPLAYHGPYTRIPINILIINASGVFMCIRPSIMHEKARDFLVKSVSGQLIAPQSFCFGTKHPFSTFKTHCTLLFDLATFAQNWCLSEKSFDFNHIRRSGPVPINMIVFTGFLNYR